MSECILIVEDENIVRKILEMQISSFGYKVHAAERPKDGISWFEQNRDDVELVLLDMNMPEMDGLEVFRKMKAIDPAVRVLVLSGYSQHGKIEAALREGVLDYLTKPVRKAVLEEKIKSILSSSSGSDAVLEKEVAGDLNSQPVFNRTFLESQFKSTPGLLEKVLESFQKNAPELFQALEEAVAGGNAEEIAETAHKFHGPVVSMGGFRAAAWVKYMEEEAEQGNIEKAESLMEGFRVAYDAMVNELDSMMNE